MRGNFSIKLLKIGLFILFLLLLLDGYLLLDSKILTIKELEIKLDKIDCANEPRIKDEVQLLGQNFFLVNNQAIEKKLKDKYLCVKGINLVKKFPNGLKIEVFRREPAAILMLLQSKNSKSTLSSLEATPSALIDFPEGEVTAALVVDSEGVIFSPKYENLNVPKIFLAGEDLKLGNKMENVLQTLKILEKVKSFGIDVKETKIYSSKFLSINKKPKIVFSLNKNIDLQLASLQLIYGQAKIEGKEMELLDLRFEKPIVKYIPKKYGTR